MNRTQCRTCLYKAAGGEGLKYSYSCEYILLTGHKRPSPPSPHCTAYRKFNKEERKGLEMNVFKNDS